MSRRDKPEPAPIPRRRRARPADDIEVAPIPGLAPAGGEPEPAPIPVPGGAKPAAKPAARPEARPGPPAATPARPRMKLPRDLIPGYELQEWLGEGSMGAVFRARQVSLDRQVAIKVLTPRLAENEAFLRRFQREAKAVARLNHPNVVSGIDVGVSRGCRYFVMEYVSGETLDLILAKRGRLPGVDATRIMLSVARALEHAYAAGLVHRDVKPANIIISGGGRVKLCDLGLAKEVNDDGQSTHDGKALGTPDYISPEQARGEADIDIRSDIYSLGATYYQTLSGRCVFDGPTAAVIMAKHLTEPLIPLETLVDDLPAGCANVCHRMLEKERTKRYQVPAELIQDLKAVAEGTWVEERPTIRRRRSSRARRRFR